MTRISRVQQGITPTLTPLSLHSSIRRNTVTETRATLDAKVYDALAEAKRWTALVAMHLTQERRRRLFTQLDRLHDISEWEVGDEPVRQPSFQTFLRTILVVKPAKWPNLGLSHDGNILAVWGGIGDRVTLEFMDADTLKWTLSCEFKRDGMVRSVGTGPAFKIRDLLAPYNPGHWFDAA